MLQAFPRAARTALIARSADRSHVDARAEITFATFVLT